MYLKTFQKIKQTDNGFYIYGKEADIKLIFMTDDIIRIRVSFDRIFKEASFALVKTSWKDDLDAIFSSEREYIPSLKINYLEYTDKIIFKTKSLKLVMYKAPISFQLFDKNNSIIYSDLKERAFDKDFLGRITHYSTIDYEYDHFYGFGEKNGILDKKGKHLRMSPKDAIGSDPEYGEPLYKHIPFYIRINENNLHALGLFYNNSYDSVFDMGNERSGYWDSYSYYQADGGDIDIFFINGPTIPDILKRYTWLTGQPVMPTKQSLGYTASTMYYAELDENCDQEIYKVINTHKKNNIYIDNFKLSSGYSSGEKDNLRYTFNWNKKRFPTPNEFVKNMCSMGINVIPNLKPGILSNHPYMDVLNKNDAFIKTSDNSTDYVGRWWGGPGKFIDFTNPKARSIWKTLLKDTILSTGIHTIWNDNCEYDGIEDRSAICNLEGNTGNMAELKIIQSNMMAYTAKQALDEFYPNERPYIINRAGFAGIQRYAQVWDGDNLTDWRTLKYNIALIVGMGLSGIANTGCDIGGFAGPAPEAELLLRWIQNGIFQPRFCINSANNDNTVTQPWMYKELLPFIQEAYAQRYKMIPYLYSLMFESHINGTPIMRPLFWEFPNDKKCYSDEHFTFMFGPSILVANVLEKGSSNRQLYLPKGCNWYDMNDNFKEYEGGQTITIPVSLSSIPMFLRDSAIYITSQDIKHISTDVLKTLDILISAKKDISFNYYDDDGISKDFEKNIYSLMNISVTAGDVTTIKVSKKNTRFKNSIEQLNINFINKDKGAYWVSINEKKLPQFLIEDEFLKASTGWYYNMSNKTVMIKTPLPKEDTFNLKISFEKFDLIGMENNG